MPKYETGVLTTVMTELYLNVKKLTKSHLLRWWLTRLPIWYSELSNDELTSLYCMLLVNNL
jgi:hypothetical protein